MDLLKYFVTEIEGKNMDAILGWSENRITNITNLYIFINIFRIEILFIINMNHRSTISMLIEEVKNEIKSIYQKNCAIERIK